MDWDKFLTKRSTQKLIERIVQSISNEADIVNEAQSFINIELIRKNRQWRKNYNPHRASPEAYLFWVIKKRTIPSFWVHKRGRFRYPKLLLKNCYEMDQQVCLLILTIYKMLCYQQLSENFIIERLKDLGKDEESISDAIEYILNNYDDRQMWKNRNLLRAHLQAQESSDQDREQNEIATPMEKSATILMKKQKLHFIFNYILRGEPEEISDRYLISQNVANFMKKARNKFKATDIECKFLRLKELREMNVTAAGKEVGWSKDVAHGKYRRLFPRFSRLFPKELLEELDPKFEN